MLITQEQFANLAAELRANPPAGQVMFVRDVDGTKCYCSLGQLAHSVGIPDEDLVSPLNGFEVIYASFALRERYGLADDVVSRIYGTNDKDYPTPAARAEAVIAAVQPWVRAC